MIWTYIIIAVLLLAAELIYFRIADRMCMVIDGQEKVELFKRILNEYNEWLLSQQRQQMCIQQFLREYYK